MPHCFAKSRREVLAMARVLKRRHGKSLTIRKFRAATGISYEMIDEMFGSWNGLRRAIGLDQPDPASLPKRSNQQIIELLRRCHRERTQDITQQDFCQLTGVKIWEIRAKFGSWKQLRIAAGLPPRAKAPRLFTNRELLDVPLRSYLRTGNRPSKWQVEFEAGRLHAVRLIDRFGSWKQVERTLDVYLQVYFLSRDPNWTSAEHEQTFVPHLDARVEWPSDTIGRDWSPATGWVHPDQL